VTEGAASGPQPPSLRTSAWPSAIHQRSAGRQAWQVWQAPLQALPVWVAAAAQLVALRPSRCRLEGTGLWRWCGARRIGLPCVASLAPSAMGQVHQPHPCLHVPPPPPCCSLCSRCGTRVCNDYAPPPSPPSSSDVPLPHEGRRALGSRAASGPVLPSPCPLFSTRDAGGVCVFHCLYVGLVAACNISLGRIATAHG
jgi:hypothetical protein